MDETLARGLPCSDRYRMGPLLAQLESRLLTVARRVVGDPDAAADVVQSAFEKVLLRCIQFRGGSRASTWMHRIVVSEALGWLRQARRRALLGLSLGAVKSRAFRALRRLARNLARA